MRQLPCQYAYGQRQEFVLIRLRIRPRCWHYTATRITPSLVPYYYLQTIIVPICIRYIDQPIAPIRLLSRPDRTIVPMRLRSTDRPIDELYVQPLSTTRRSHRTATYRRQTDSAAMPAITILIVPVCLQSTNQTFAAFTCS